MKLLFPVFFLLFLLPSCQEGLVPTDDIETENCCNLDAISTTIGNSKILIPNVFTPDVNGINDVLIVQGSNAATIQSFIVRDENENIVYQIYDVEVNNSSFGWDGSSNGTTLIGVFSVTVEITALDGTTGTLAGEVCCLPCQGDDITEAQLNFDSKSNCIFSTQHDGQGGIDPSLPTFEECFN